MPFKDVHPQWGEGCSCAVPNWLALFKFHVNEASVGRWKSQVKNTQEKVTGENPDLKCLVYLLKLNMCPHCDPAVAFLGVYPTERHKKTCRRMFIAALFIKAKSWKLHKCPLTIERINKLWYFLHSGIIYSNWNKWSTSNCNIMGKSQQTGFSKRSQAHKNTHCVISAS